MILHAPTFSTQIVASGKNTMYFKNWPHFEANPMIEKAGQASLNAKIRNSAAQSANLAGSIQAITVFPWRRF